MNKLLKLTILGTSIMSMFSLSSKAPVKTKADDTLTRVGIIFEEGKDNTDSAYVINQIVSNTGLVTNKRSILFGFDTKEEVSSILRMHFRVTYREETFWDKVRNDYLERHGEPRKHGKVTETTETITSDLEYSFKTERYQLVTGSYLNRPAEYVNPLKIVYPSIGLVSQLLEAENEARNILPTSFTNDYVNLIKTGGYELQVTAKHRINDSSKSLANRKYYAVIPMSYSEDIAPESIACYDVYGNLIADGLDENGDPFSDEYGTFVEAKVSKDFAVAINGKDAKLTRIRVTNFPTSSSAVVLLQNAGYDKEKHEIINIKNTLLVNDNFNKIMNWEINELNRYIFIKFDNAGDLDLSTISIKFYYTNSDNKVAFLINVTDKDGNFLPPPLIPPRPEGTPGISFKELFVAFGFLLGAAIGLVIIYDIFRQVIRRA